MTCEQCENELTPTEQLIMDFAIDMADDEDRIVVLCSCCVMLDGASIN
jgi:hypothetical protein